MEYATKMVLVPSDFITKMDTTKFSKLDIEMHNILHDTTLDDSIKWKMYTQILQRHLHIESEKDKPIEIKITEAISNQEKKENAIEKIDHIFQELELDVPKTLRKKALELYNILKNEDTISWNDDGEISVNGFKIAKSNISSLIINSVRSTKNSFPLGWSQFSKYILDNGVPEHILGKNVKRHTIELNISLPSTPEASTSFVSKARTNKSNNRFSPFPKTWTKYKL